MMKSSQVMTNCFTVIMGYGFSLFRNPSDQFALETASLTSSKIMAIKAYQIACNQKTRVPTSNDKPPSPPSAKTTSTEVYWIRLPTHTFSNYEHAVRALRFFPQGLIDEVSVIVANERELARIKVAPYRYWIDDAEDSHLTRNRLNSMCHLTMLLQKYRAGIREYNSSLPPWPKNDNQLHAARYRRSQLRILETVIEALLDSLREVVNPSPSAGLDNVYIVTLEDILSSSPPSFSHDFRSTLKTTLHTRSAAKIRQNGWADLVFTLWICGLWVWESLNLSDDDASTNSEDEATEFHKAITHWLSFINNTYPRTLPPQDPLPPTIMHQWSSTDARTETSPSTHGGTTSLTPEIFHIVESYLDVIRIIAEHDPDSIFAHESFTLERLAWGLNIVKQEGFMCPSLRAVEGEEGDEWVLCLERKAEMLERIEDVGSVARGRVVERSSVFASGMTI